MRWMVFAWATTTCWGMWAQTSRLNSSVPDHGRGLTGCISTTRTEHKSRRLSSGRLERGTVRRQSVASPSRVKNLMLAHIVATSALQAIEDDRRYDGQYPECHESLVDSPNHFRRSGECTGDEKRC